MFNYLNILDKNINADCGFYIVDNEVFFSKTQALLSASKSLFKENLEIKYYLNDHILKNYPYHIEPPESLEKIYLERAKKIRDEYDYVIIMFSGGADSTNILDTYLENNIKIDEVISYGAWNSHIDKSNKVNLEVMIGGSSMIKRIKKENIKFTHINWLEKESMDRVYNNVEWVWNCGSQVTPNSDLIDKNLYNNPRLLALCEKGKKVCVIWGRDKPAIKIIGRKYFFYYCDGFINEYINDSISKNNFPIKIINFYIEPRIMAKQANIIINYLDHNRSSYDLFIKNQSTSQDEKNTERLSIVNHQVKKIINTLVYKNYNSKLFDLGKPTSLILPFKQYWFTTNKESIQYKNWLVGVKEFLQNIDLKYKKKSYHSDEVSPKLFYKWYFIKDRKNI